MAIRAVRNLILEIPDVSDSIALTHFLTQLSEYVDKAFSARSEQIETATIADLTVAIRNRSEVSKLREEDTTGITDRLNSLEKRITDLET